MDTLRLLSEKMAQYPWRWSCFLTLISVAGYVSYAGLSQDLAITVHAYAGYGFCAVALAALTYYTFRVLQEVDFLRFIQQRWRGITLVLLVAIFMHLFKPHMMRVFNDEPAHQMVAKHLHEKRVNAVPEVAYYLEGDLIYGERSLNYRMYFYSFLVSVMHDLAGFRVSNGLFVNAFLGLLLFLSVYIGGNLIFSNGGGVCAVLLLAGLPLLDETIASYGYDITNLLFLSLLFIGLFWYAEHKSDLYLNWLIALGIGLAYSRNESVLYLLLITVLVAWVFLKKGSQSNLTWFGALSPLLLLPVFAARGLFSSVMASLSEMFPHLGSDQFFSLHFIPENLIRTGAWLFDFSTATSSYPVLAFFGAVGLIAIISALGGDILKKKPWRQIDGVLLLFSLTALGGFVFITLALFWNPVAGEAVRFLLPLHLAFTYASVWLLSRATNANFWMPVFVLIAICGIFFIAIPSKMRAIGGANIVFGNYAKWSLDWLADKDDANTLYLSQLNTLFILHDYPAMDLNRANENGRKVIQLEVERYYSRIVVFVIERYNVRTGRWAPPSPSPPLSERFVTKVLDERRWAYNQRARFLEVTAYREDSGEVLPIDEIPSIKYDFDTFNSYWSAMRQLHPGLDR
jgi:hypothetical protein